MEYVPLEKDNLKPLGIETPTFGGVSTSFYATSSFVYTLLFVAIVGAAFYQYTIAGIHRMEATQNSISKSNDIIKRVTLGLLGVFSLFLILFTINKGMLRGDIGLGGLKAGNTGASSGKIPTGTGVVTTYAPGSGGSNTCESAATIQQKIASGNICAGTSCKMLSGCNYSEHLPIIKSEAASQGVDAKLIVAIICKESTANKKAVHKNEDDTFDCGLMQINNGKNACPDSLFDPAENIKRGVTLLKSAIQRSTMYPIVGGIPSLGNALSGYNCCSTNTVAASPSNDCTKASGFTETIPKWACPINPGTSQFNMCSVKNYACEVIACMGSVNL